MKTGVNVELLRDRAGRRKHDISGTAKGSLGALGIMRGPVAGSIHTTLSGGLW